MHALFRGTTQIAGTFPSARECLKAALAEGLISEVQISEAQFRGTQVRGTQVSGESRVRILPGGYHIDRVQEPYDPQPAWKLPREIS